MTGELTPGNRSDTARSIDPYLGRVFVGKYRIDRLVGEGGMGRVYEARQLALDKIVCLKVVRRELADDETQARFQREARAASRLNHPNSIQVLDFGAGEEGELYLVIEYVDGRDLQQLSAEAAPMPEPRVCHLMAQVLDALTEAHSRMVVHRDLKPENIMVTSLRGDPDFVKVLDFGIATIQDGKSRITRAGVVFGTPEYLSPEQARGEELDGRSDVYSAGVILYQLVTGRLPFQSTTPMGYVLKHAQEPPLPPRQALPTLSPAMESLIERALSKRREERPVSASAMRDELLAIGRAEEVGTVALAAKPRSPRRATPVLAGALFATALLAGAFWLARDRPREARAVSGNPAARPDNLSSFLAKADAAFQAERYDEALAAYARAARLPSAPAMVEKKIGLCYQLKGDRASAAAHYGRYVGSTPTPPDADQIRRLIAQLER